MKNNKNKVYLIIAISALLVFAIGSTYAFFQILGGETQTKEINVQTYTADEFTLNVSNDIEINETQSNFGMNGNNLKSTTSATAL